VPGDVEAAAAALSGAGRPVIHVFLGVSDVHLARKLRMTRAEAVRAVERSVKQARECVADVQFSAEDATRADRVFLRQCIETAISAGATRINVPDTVGYAMPREYGALIADIVRFVEGQAIVSAHCHDDMGLATANSVAAVEAGARQVEVTVNGIGERAGNASSEQVAVVMAMKRVAETGVDLTRVTAMSRRVSEITGVPVQPNTPIVGANAFAHASGIHQDGIIKDPENYEFVPPSLVGAPGHRIVFTARSGRGALAHRAAAIGCQLDAEAIDAAYRHFIDAAEQGRGEVTDEEVSHIIRRVAYSQ
jgi:2-isopropylmalate synthase